MRVEGNAYFDCRLHRAEGDELAGGRPNTDKQIPGRLAENRVEISPVKFSGPVVFNGATFLNQVDFRKAVFAQRADFTGVTCAGEVSFKKAKFQSGAIFREARFTSLKFDHDISQKTGWSKNFISFLWALRSKKSRQAYRERKTDTPESQFAGGVDMRGCVYERIETKLECFIRQMQLRPREAIQPAYLQRYDRQPYTQMIKTLRAVGDDRRAEFVYVRQRLRELKVTWDRFRKDLRNGLLWRSSRGLANLSLDFFLYVTAKYGVQPERLFFISIAVIILGARIFSFGGAVQYKDPNIETMPTATIKVAEGAAPWRLEVNKPADERINLEWRDSLRFSLSQFLPIIDIPAGSKWKPSQRGSFWIISRRLLIPYDVYGSAHRLLGAILVPLLLAAVAAALYRRFKTDM